MPDAPAHPRSIRLLLCIFPAGLNNPTPLMPSILPLILMLALAGGTVFVVAALMLALVLLRPPRMTDGKAVYLLGRLSPGDLGLTFQPLRFNVRDKCTGRDLAVSAWWIPASVASSRCVVLLHGRADAKVGAIAWAPLLHRLGWNVFAPDMRAHGESEGRFSTAGACERHDVAQLIDQLQSQYHSQSKTIVLLGLSMGAGIAVGTATARTDIVALILDSMFCSFSQASWDHMRLMGLEIRPLHRLAVAMAGWLSGCDLAQVVPIRWLMDVPCPILMIDGTEDALIPPSARDELNLALQARSDRGRRTEHWSAPEAGHLQAYTNPQEYEDRVGRFLARTVEQRP